MLPWDGDIDIRLRYVVKAAISSLLKPSNTFLIKVKSKQGGDVEIAVKDKQKRETAFSHLPKTFKGFAIKITRKPINHH